MGLQYPIYAIAIDILLIATSLALFYYLIWKPNVEKYLSRGQAALGAGDMVRAIKYFRKFVEAKDTPGKTLDEDARNRLSEAYHGLGDAYSQQPEMVTKAVNAYLRIKELGGGLSKSAILTVARHSAEAHLLDQSAVDVYLAALQLQLVDASSDDPILLALRDACFVDEKTAPESLKMRIAHAKKAIKWAPALPWPFLFAGIGLYRLDEFDESLDFLKKAAELNPDEPLALYWLGQIFLKKALDDQDGIRTLEMFLAFESKDKDIVAKKAQLAFEFAERLLTPLLDTGLPFGKSQAESKNLKKILQLLTLVVKLSPFNDHAYYYLGEISRLTGNPKAALGHYAKAVEIAPQKMPYLLSMAIVAFDLGELDQSRSVCEQVLAINPKHLESLHLLIKISHRQNDLAELEKFCTLALDAGDDQPETHYYYIMALYEQEKYEQVCQNYSNGEKLQGLDDQGMESIFYLARSHALRGDKNTAGLLFEKLPDLPRNKYYHACLLANMGQNAAALSMWDLVSQKAGPYRIKALLQCGYLLNNTGEQGADSYYLKALKIEKNNEEVLTALGLHYLSCGDFDKASTYGLRLQKSYPANPHGFWIMGQVHEEQRQYSQAIKDYEQLRGNQLYTDRIMPRIGILYFRARRIDDALSVLEKLHKAGEADEQMLFYLGLCYAKLDRFADAIHIWKLLLAQKQGDGRIINNLSHVYYRWAEQLIQEKKWAEAAYQLENIIALEPTNQKAKSSLAQLYFNIGMQEIMKGAESSDLKVNEFVEKSFSLQPDYHLSAFYMALSDLYKKKYPEAIEKFMQLAKKYPKDRRIQYYYALAQYYAGELTTARVLFKKLLKQSTDDVYGNKIALLLADEHINDGQYQKAAQLLGSFV